MVRGTLNGSFKATKIIGFSRQVQLATYTCNSTFVHAVARVWYLHVAMLANENGQDTLVVWDMPQDVTT